MTTFWLNIGTSKLTYTQHIYTLNSLILQDMNKREKLENLNAKWKEECQCELKKTATQAVPGDGNPEAEIVFIGEAPGKSEDQQGKPFVGAAGKFLAEMLEAIKLKREDIYITNIVKYRPPDNRDPLPKEIAACAPWL